MLQRIWLYLKEMYPPLPAAAMAFVSFFNLWFMLAVAHVRPLEVTWKGLAGAGTLFLFLLFLRVSDELKDLESDKVLFPERLVPSGKVHVSDLHWLMGLSVAGMVWLNLTMTGALLAFGVLFGYGVLMYHYFFQRELISGSLIMALVTHNPSVLLMNGYVIAMFCHDLGIPAAQPYHLYLLILFWLPGLAWELARKLRAPADETAYETYSKVFGYKLGALIPLGVIGLNYFMIVRLHDELFFSLPFLGLLSLALLAVVAAFIRFIFNPNSRTARLKPVTEAYMLVSAVGLLVDLVWQRGLLWSL